MSDIPIIYNGVMGLKSLISKHCGGFALFECLDRGRKEMLKILFDRPMW